MKRIFTAAALAVFSLGLGSVAQAQDVTAGKKTFKKCAACHKIGDGAKNGVGPVLNNVVGRQAGTFEGYKYGKSMVAAGEAGLVWSEELITEYITDPKKFLRALLDDPKAKAKMTFRLKKEEQRADVVAYVAGFSPDAAATGEGEGEGEGEAVSTTDTQ